MKVRPLGDRVLVERQAEETKTKGGIIIPDSASKERPIIGKVVAVGQGRTNDKGEVKALEVKAGDKVLYGKYSGTDVKVDDKEYLILREEDILAIVEG